MSTPETLTSIAHHWEEYTLLETPLYLKSEVIRGFGRGAKELGCPTANMQVEVIQDQLAKLDNGIYLGFATLEGHDEVYNAVMSIGYNPFYDNKDKAVEVHLIHTFDDDFYGSTLSVVVAAYIRPELNFDSLQALVDAIQTDIAKTNEWVTNDDIAPLRSDDFLLSSSASQ